MSGICGCIHSDDRPVPPAVLSAMTDAAAHRGPDGIRTWKGDRAGLAHLALHVTPEDEREQQPLVDGDLVLVADARIDNRDDLRSTLRPHLDTTHPTDADLILGAYRRWGTDCAQHLIGDFAFAIWDATNRSLFAARDPMAMRALYYRAEPSRLLFATEVKQILAAPDVPRRLYDPMVAAYLLDHHAEAPWTTWTFYEGILQVPPAHAMVWRDGSLRTWEYWDLDWDRPLHYATDREYVEHFRTLFVEAVRCRLRSIHPVSALLSGGLDSGSTVSVAARLLAEAAPDRSMAPALQTLSWAFPTLPGCDERFISDHITHHFGLPATALDVDAIPLLGTGPYQQLDADEPYAQGFYALLNASFDRARSEGARVLLSGFRGDLVTGEWMFDYGGLLRRGQWHTLWKDLRTHSTTSGHSIWELARYYFRPSFRSVWPGEMPPGLRSIHRRVRRLLSSSDPQPVPQQDWISPDLRSNPVLRALPEWKGPPAAPHTRRRRYEGLRSPRAARAASWLDRLGARFGVSHADPWSDRRLAQFAVSVPPRILCRAGTNKHIVREAMKGLIPASALQHAKKVYPKAQHERALKEHRRDTVRAILKLPLVARLGYANASALREYYEAYRQGGDEDYRFWHVLMLEQWLRQHHEAMTTT